MTTKQIRPPQPGSMVERLASLEIGGNLTVSQAHGDVKDSFDGWVSATKRRMIGNITPIIARTTDRYPERDFEIETGVMVSGQNRIHVVLVVTRLADKG